jgi:hypothetical protein
VYDAGSNNTEETFARLKQAEPAIRASAKPEGRDWPWLPWIVLIFELGLTGLSAWRLNVWAVESDRAKFNGLVKQLREQLETRMEKYELGMQLLQSNFHGNVIKSEKDWKFALDLMGIRWNFPGLFELGYAHYFTDSWKADPPEIIMKTNWFRVPKHRDFDSNGVEIPGRTLPVIFHFVEDRARPFDYGAELYPNDVAKDLPVLAIKTGGIYPSDRKEFLARNSFEKRVGITFYLPVYEFHKATHAWMLNGVDLGQARDAGQSGVIFFSVDMTGFLKSMWGTEPQEVAFEIFSSPEPREDQWLNPAGRDKPMAVRAHNEVYMGESKKCRGTLVHGLFISIAQNYLKSGLLVTERASQQSAERH